MRTKVVVITRENLRAMTQRPSAEQDLLHTRLFQWYHLVLTLREEQLQSVT